MTNLSVMFDELVLHPAADPTPIDELLARGQRRRTRRFLSGAAGAMALVVSLGIAVSMTSDTGSATVRVTASGNKEASYRSTADGGYKASGDWAIRIERAGQTVVIASGSDSRCGPRGVIKQGDRVFAQIRNDRSYLEIGPRAHC